MVNAFPQAMKFASALGSITNPALRLWPRRRRLKMSASVAGGAQMPTMAGFASSLPLVTDAMSKS